MTDKELKEVYALYTDLWKLFREYHEAQTDEEWEKLQARAEEIVKQYSVSLYIEAAARNEAAIRLYRKLGYDCLNTITIRKDFPGYEYDVVRKEKIHELEFEIRKDKAL